MAEQSTFLSRSEKLEINDDKEVLSQKQQQQQFETTVPRQCLQARPQLRQTNMAKVYTYETTDP